ncbi:tetratricopeptide repeat protein [Sorangium sp. So ce861]|uniref:tetratricopeptide repeat protein n=1 Tax=Sorangium sp. So ce861 TaxID=3133323 RepID=UPI003F5FC763
MPTCVTPKRTYAAARAFLPHAHGDAELAERARRFDGFPVSTRPLIVRGTRCIFLGMDAEAANSAPNAASTTAADVSQGTRLWVDGRLVTSPAEASIALQRVRALKQRGPHVRKDLTPDAGGTRPKKAPEAPPAGSGDVDPLALLQIAGDLFQQLRVKEAIRIYESVASIPKARAEANVGLGWCYLHLRDFDRSIRRFEEALDAQPGFGRALYGAGIALLELGRLEEAASYAQRLAGLPGKEERARGLYVLGLVDRAGGAWEQAAAHLEESLATYPHRRKAQPGWSEIRHRYELALCYRELNHLERALEHLAWAARHERKPGPIAIDLAKLYLELERYDEAETQFQAVLKHDPRSRPALVGLGRVHLAREDYRGAIQNFSKVLSRASNDLDALKGMADCYKGVGDLDRAAGYLEQLGQLYKTPRVQMEKRLQSLQKERQMRDAELLRMRNIAALNIMATGIAHELRQPLSLIRLAAQNARLDLKKGIMSHIDADLSDIDEGIVRLDKVITLLRDAATDDFATDETVELDAAIDAARLLFDAQLGLRGIQVIVEHTRGVRILGSRVALQQVLSSLISNARDALTEAQVKQIRISAEQEGDKVWINVSDTGCGMSEAVREQALAPFFTTKKSGGMGLGLYFCYNLVARMKGTLRVKETSIGRGTTIEIQLRRAEGEDRG